MPQGSPLGATGAEPRAVAHRSNGATRDAALRDRPRHHTTMHTGLRVRVAELSG